VTPSEDTLIKNEKGGTRVSERNKEQQVEDEVQILIPRRVDDRDEDVEFTSRYDESCRSCQSNDLSTLAKDREGHIVLDCSAAEGKVNEGRRRDMSVNANRALCFTTTCSKTGADDTQSTKQRIGTRQRMTDDRMITAEQLRSTARQNDNLSEQQEHLYTLLININNI
jgi:hypothetical protein